VYSKRLSAPAAELRRAARAARNSRPALRQHDPNPLVDRPFITLADGTWLAPQPLFVAGRFSLAALYYAGVAAYGNDFATDLGKVNEEYVLEQLDQLSGFGAAVSGEIEYEKSTFSTDAFVVLPDQVLFVEVKSRRPALDKRLDAVSYTNLLGEDVGHAQDQLRTTYDLWRGGHPAFAHMPADARPVRGLIVVPEPLYLADHTMFRHTLRQMPFPTAVISFTELEQLVAAAVAERSGRVLADLTTESPFLSADASAALTADRARMGTRALRNAMLDASFEAMRWTSVDTT
jgi:hypothetical protein